MKKFLAVSVTILSMLAPAMAAGSPAPIDLGRACSFAALDGSGFTNTGNTILNGDLGSYPTVSETGTGTVAINGIDHDGDTHTQDAQTDLAAAYTDGSGRAITATLDAELGGTTLTAGVYNSTATFGITGTLTLDGGGDGGSVFIFIAGSTITTADFSAVNLINGAQAGNVFWIVGSSASLGKSSVFEGTIIAVDTITLVTGASVSGRLLAMNGQVILDTNTVGLLNPCGMPTTTVSATNTPTPTTTMTIDISTATSTETPAETLTSSPTLTQTITASSQTGTATNTATLTSTPGESQTITQTMTETQTSGGTVTNTATSTATPGESQTITQTMTETPAETGTMTSTATSTATPGESQTITQTMTETPAETGTMTMTSTATLTNTPGESQTTTQTMTETPTETGTTGTMTITATLINTPGESQTITQTMTETLTEAGTITNTTTPTNTPGDSQTITQTMTGTGIQTATTTNTETATFSATQITTVTQTYTPSATPVNIVDLETTGSYAVLSSTFTRNNGISALTGDLGYTSLSGGGSHTVSGTTYVPAPSQSGLDQGAALVSLDNYGCTFIFADGAIDLESDATHGTAGVYTPGVYCINGAMSVGGGGIITLNGKGIYLFRSTGAFNTSDNSKIVLTGGASACDVFWTPGEAASLGANTIFIGTVIDASGITAGNNTVWTGRALAYGGTVTLDTDSISVPACGITGTATNTGTPTMTITQTIIGTVTPSVSPTMTQTAASTPTETDTIAAVQTRTFTETPTPSSTNSYTETATQSGTQTFTPTYTYTQTMTQTSGVTPSTTASPTLTLTPAAILIKTYPNPVNPFTNDLYLSFYLNSDSNDVRMAVYTTALRHVRDIPAGAGISGKNIAVIQGNRLQGLARGTYYYCVISKSAGGGDIKGRIEKLVILY